MSQLIVTASNQQQLPVSVRRVVRLVRVVRLHRHLRRRDADAHAHVHRAYRVLRRLGLRGRARGDARLRPALL